MITEVLGAMVIALASGILGNVIGTRNTVQKPFCDQLRSSCQALLVEKLEHLADKVDILTKVVNGKILGL